MKTILKKTIAKVGVAISKKDVVGIYTGLSSLKPSKTMEIDTCESGNGDFARFKKTGLWS